MKTLYCMAIVNRVTGDVAHCVVSDGPLPDKDLVGVEHATTTEYFTIDCEDNDFIRARDMLPDLDFTANVLSLNPSPELAARVLTGITPDISRRRAQ